jgi:hypothetical protein
MSKQLTGGQIAEQICIELKATVKLTNYLERMVRSVKRFCLPVTRVGAKSVAPQGR